jgi:hypothetical protein
MLFYRDVLLNAIGLQRRAKINFSGDGVTVVDNPTTQSTDVIIGTPPVPVTSPTEISNLYSWIDADGYSAGTITPLYGAASPTQAVSGKRPVKALDALFNNRNTLTFDGVDDDMSVAAFMPPPPYTIFSTFRVPSGGANNYLFGGYFSVGGYHFVTSDNTSDKLSLETHGLMSAAAQLATPHAWGASHDGTNMRVWRAGKWINTFQPSSNPSGTNTAFHIASGGAGGYANLVLGNLMVYNRALNDLEMLKLWAYCQDRYALANAWPTQDVWLCIGDSEMVGANDPATGLPVGYPPTDGSLLMIKDDLLLAQLTEPCNGAGLYPPSGTGPAGLFGWYASQAHGGRKTVVINAGVGGTRTDQWLYSTSPTSNYQKALARIRTALAIPGAQFRGILWYIGANDAAYSATPDWGGNSTLTMTAMKADIGPAANGKPVIFTRLPATVPTDVAYPGWAYVRAAQNNWAIANEQILAQAPEGPWREAYNLHLAPAANIVLARDVWLPLWQSHGSYA